MDRATLDEIRGRLDALIAQAAALEALDFNPDQARDADGKFGSGGGSDKTGEMTPVGGGHRGGDATGEMTPVGGAHGDHKGTGHKAANDNQKSGPRDIAQKQHEHAESAKKAAEAEHAEDHRRLKETSKNVADTTGKLAKERTERAERTQTRDHHERAGNTHRVASGAHKIAAELHPENADHHLRESERHARQAEHHDREVAKREHEAANAMNITNANRVPVNDTALAASANGTVTQTMKFTVDCVQLAAIPTTNEAFHGVAPTEFRMFKAGENPSVKGVFLFDDKAAEMVMSRYKLMGRRLTFDYDHGALIKNSQNPAQTAKSAGFFDLELRNGDLWAVNVQFTPAAKKAVEDGEWPYFSPAFARETDKDGKEGSRPVWVINSALTANPALFDLDVLAEAANAIYESDQRTLALSASPSPAEATESARRREAVRTASRYLASSPATKVLPLAQPNHPAATLPLTFAYDVGAGEAAGWLGGIEPAGVLQTPAAIAAGAVGDRAVPTAPAGTGRDWICFVALDGKSYLWTEREPAGGIVGDAIVWMRDLTTLTATSGTPPTAQPTQQPAVPSASPTKAPMTFDLPTMLSALSETAMMALRAIAAPVVALDVCRVVDADDYDWRRRAAMAMSEATFADPNLTIDAAPDHPAATSPLTGRFSDPLKTGASRWLGWIEPINGEWICFVCIDGRAILWTQRQNGHSDMGINDGAGIGKPIVFQRDLATLSVTGDAAIVQYAAFADPTTLSAVPYRGYPEPKDDPTTWDADASLHRLRKWASSDGSGDTDKIDWNKYGEGFAYVADPAAGQSRTLDDFKLPHHDVRHGELVTIRRAVYQAAGRIAAAGIPEQDIAAVQDHLARHYHQWGARAPWEQIPDGGKATAMHAKLSDYAAKMGFDKKALKARLKLALPGHLHSTAMDATGDDASKHPDDKTMAKMMKALKTLDAMEEDDDAPDSEREEAKIKAAALAALNQGDVPSVVALGAALGMAPGSPEADVIKGVANALHGLGKLSALTGEQDVSAALAKVQAWRTSADEGKNAVAALNAIRTENAKREAITALDAIVTQKGLSPAQRTEALSILDTDGQVALNAYLRAATGNPALANAGNGNGTPPQPSSFTALSAAQIECLNRAGLLPGAAPVNTPAPGTPPAAPTATVALSAKAASHCRRMKIDPTSLNADEITSLNGMTFDSDE